METPENPYRYESKDRCAEQEHSDDPSGFCCVMRIPRDPENPGHRELSLGRALLIVFCVHVAAVAVIYCSHHWHLLMREFLDWFSKLAELRNPIAGG